MKEYPATSKPFKVNGKTFKMQKLTLGLQAKIEDENIDVKIMDVIKSCTDMGDNDIMDLTVDQFDAIYVDIAAFTYTTESKEEGEAKKPSS